MSANMAHRMDYDTQAYWSGLAEGRLLITRCEECQTWIHPPKGCCPSCWSDNISRVEPSGKATLFSYLVAKSSGNDRTSIVGWAELMEQDRLLIVAPVIADASLQLEIGCRLELAWSEKGSIRMPVFKLGLEK